MKTNNAMQLKARVKRKAQEAGIPAQAMMQHYLFERLLERISQSQWRDHIKSSRGVC